jgi:hypothetical protein
MSELKGARKVLKRALRDAKAKAKAKAKTKTKTKTKTKPTAKNIAELRKRVAEENARQKKAKRPRIPVIDRTIDPKKISPSNYKNID